jgi:two-component system OmpR family response regulator
MRILLVEDDEALAGAVREQIAVDGHAVDCVGRLGDANDDVRAVAYDLILLDLMLPDGRGLDFLKQLRKAGRRTESTSITSRFIGASASVQSLRPHTLRDGSV